MSITPFGARARAAASSPRSLGSRVGMGAVLGTAIAAFALAFGPASPALAHDQLVGTSPTNGEVVATAPEKLTLSFNNDIIEVGTVVEVTAPDGSSAAAGDPTVAGTEVTQVLGTGLPDGSYTVVWRVVSKDGHPISGTQSFAIGAASEGAETPVTPEPEAEESAEHSHDESTEHGEESDGQMHTMGEEAGQTSPWPWIGLGVAGVLAVGAVVFAVRAAGRRKNAAPEASSDDADAPTE